jgi:predicted Zn-dependent peptidase
VAGAILGSGKGSRLYRRLVREEQLATEVSVFTFDLAKGSDLLIVDATARPGISGEALEAAIGRELTLLAREGTTPNEVARACALITTDFVVSLQSAQSRADKLSQYATYLGDPRRVNEEVERYQRVTASDINTAAKEYLGEDNRASLLYVPRDGSTSEEG